MQNNFIKGQSHSQVGNRTTDAEIVLPNGNVIRKEDLKLYGYTELSVLNQSSFLIKNFDLTKHPGFDELIATFGKENVRDFCLDHKYGEEIVAQKLSGIFKFVWFGLLARKNGKFQKGKFKS
jgi:hypothetical protein